MSAFASNFAASSGTALLSVHGEQVTYTPFGGTPRTIMAIVERQAPVNVSVHPGATAPSAILRVLDRGTSIVDDGYGGILASAIDTGRDQISFSKRTGGTPEARNIRAVSEQASGMLTLEMG